MQAKRQRHGNVLAELAVHSKAVVALLTCIRDEKTSCADFVRHSDRLSTLLVEEGLGLIAPSCTVRTPTGLDFHGLDSRELDFCVISIVRSGDIIADAFKRVHPGACLGKVLIQRLEHTEDKRSELQWSKLPRNLLDRQVIFVVDPMLATGGSAINCLRVLRDVHGVDLHRVVFLNIICAPEGLDLLGAEFPQVRIVTCAIDDGLNADKYICPGLGDYGDRYYGTTA